MNFFDIAAVLVALLTSIAIVLLERIVPGLGLRTAAELFLGAIDFDQTLMHGLLCFLLFAGALHVDLDGLIEHRGLVVFSVLAQGLTVRRLLVYYGVGQGEQSSTAD